MRGGFEHFLFFYYILDAKAHFTVGRFALVGRAEAFRCKETDA
jgi:hypothetical protein